MDSQTANCTFPVILASTSRYRGELLERLQISFRQVAPNCDETPLAGESAEALTRRLSHEKAASVFANCPDSCVIGSDQVAVCEGVILGKPGSIERAHQQLTFCQGRSVAFLTGVCLLTPDAKYESTVVTTVNFRTLDSDTISRYLALDQPFDCAGSFKAEQLGISLCDAISSDDPTALTGLPLITVCQFLAEAGITIPMAEPNAM